MRPTQETEEVTIRQSSTQLSSLVLAVAVGVLVGAGLALWLDVATPAVARWAIVLAAGVVAAAVTAIVAGVIRSFSSLRRAHSEVVAQLERLKSEEAADSRRLTTDPVTGLPGPEAFEAALRRRLETESGAPGAPFAVAAIRLPRIADIHAAHGRAVAAQLLHDVAHRLRNSVRVGDLVGRLYGETLAIAFDGVADESSGAAQVERIHATLSAPFRVGSDEIVVHGEIGLVLGASKYGSAESVVRAAETAAAGPKRQGSHVNVFRTEMQVLAQLELRIETDLWRAVEQREIVVHYQPIINLRDRELAGFEALVRWVRASGNVVSPLEFIPVAESTGAIVGIGREVLRQACEQLVEWTRAGVVAPDTTISVNVSAVQFARSNLVADVTQALERSRLAPHRLKLEVTESAVMEDMKATVGVLAELRARGVQVAIDDFGTGHSSLAYLQRLPIDVLKIDRSFVTRMRADRESMQIVRTVLGLARALNLAVVAEGVESELDFVTLDGAGCDYAQGYWMARPLAAPAVPAFTAEWPGRRMAIAAPSEAEEPPPSRVPALRVV